MSDAAHEALPQRSRERRARHRNRVAEGEPAASVPGALEEEAVAMRTRGEAPQYEFLDHTADVQIHSWGATLEEVMEWQVLGMFNYMTETATVEPKKRVDVTVTDAHDLRSLLFKLMDEFLFHFSAEFFTVHEVRITRLDTEKWELEASAWGEQWDRTKHTIGTEVKAITFMLLRILAPGEDKLDDDEAPEDNRAAVPDDCFNAYVVIDI
eukprot:TRINITY_DN19318_c0_g1_i2.p2 TRINITY_DN19318_c0_g1~~TRINITY_DN19318_c0_g1_i2.p2  ORF type:complete len:210 (+),score=79.08 TRINITY_DN19318_c0_g1_i2:43-672(+)